MSTGTTLQIESTSSEQTEAFAEQVGAALRGGEVLVLSSDLGGGKTTFVRGLARGAGSTDQVGSPTFTISRVYEAPHFEIHHFDFYRLQHPGVVAHELHDVVGDPHVVVAIEWGDIVDGVVPDDAMRITIDQDARGHRLLRITYPKKLAYAVEALTA